MNPTWELTGKRWAIQLPFAYPEVLTVRYFSTAEERDRWVDGSNYRRAVGKRHPAVKDFRCVEVMKWKAAKEVAP